MPLLHSSYRPRRPSRLCLASESYNLNSAMRVTGIGVMLPVRVTRTTVI
jgi:hypothetical protein